MSTSSSGPAPSTAGDAATSGAERQQAEGNHLLRRLPPEEYALLLPHLEPLELELHTTLYQRGKPVDAVYFIERGAASLIVDMQDGSSVEAGTVGNEGFEGIYLFLGSEISPIRSVIQVPGHGKRLDAARFRELIPQCPTLHALLHRYTLAFMTLVSQSAACNRLHPLEQRCARWLLLSHDRVNQDPEFYLTQEYLATMLGVRRAGVSEAASALKRAGIIRYSRGRVTVLDRARLEAASCECYEAVRREFERLVPETSEPDRVVEEQR